jgi:hypothetical protein
MKLVKDDVVEPIGVRDDGAVELALPRHRELEHHEICEQDIRLCFSDPIAVLLAFLPSIPRKGRRSCCGKPHCSMNFSSSLS